MLTRPTLIHESWWEYWWELMGPLKGIGGILVEFTIKSIFWVIGHFRKPLRVGDLISEYGRDVVLEVVQVDKKTRLKYLHTEYMHREFPILIGNCYDYNNYVARGAHTGNQDELKARFL
jgi:hypothetical protein